MNSLNKYQTNTIDLIILAVIDCMKVKWHNIYINKNTTGNDIYLYFIDYYENYLDIDLNVYGKTYKLKNIHNIIDYISDDPYRMCIYIYF